MDWFEVEIFARWLHVIGACVLLGTGAGIAFFALMAHRTKNVSTVAHTMSIVVIADTIFTATAAIVQPMTGVWLATLVGWPLSAGWILASIGLYIFIGVFWLPVVWIQIKMRNLTHEALNNNQDLPNAYHRLFKYWFACGIPAFLAILIIFWLMLAQPDITF